MADLLVLDGLSAGYGRAVVLSDIALRLGEGEALAVLGRNGVGKTTLIDSIVGVTRRFAGSMTLGGREIATLAPEARALLGIDQRKLTDLSGLSLPTIQRMEASDGVIRGNVDSLMKLVAALDAAGIELIAENAASAGGGRGVRLKRAAS